MKLKSLVIIFFAVCMQKLSCKAHFMQAKDTNDVIRLNKQAWAVSTDDPELSRQYAAEAIRISNAINYAKGLSYSYNIYGKYYKDKSKYDSAMFYYRKSLEIREKLGDPLNIARSYRNVMSVEELQGDNKKAIKTALAAITLLNQYIANPGCRFIFPISMIRKDNWYKRLI